MTKSTALTAVVKQEASEPVLSDEVLQLIDHIAEILAKEFAAAMQLKKEGDDARSSLR